ncbi:preprotein translocase subunit SecG [Segetibacter sp. 3557_3]|uniref:preprotein translocase subunit SecG n=1 Tax=Segetibacter sp. 3557_3 TaxID=2547429 RepID=UPI0010589F71|nr:preprotein translocase subunit SecG [Segetibacter sp. 3557_3]TDH26398.1 preprotein translocase subunit SecG [Segetibacter sp. 3557_3]
MTILFLILIVLCAAVLGFIILVQNPKGGGLSGNVAGLSNQFMGVKQTTDVLEKGTWIFASVIAVLCLVSSLFLQGDADDNANPLNKINTSQGTTAPRPAAPASGTPAPAPVR